jgi:membrane-bound lytic murein transglycosylase D
VRALALFVAITAAHVAHAVPAEFEKPAAIAANVAFWKRVYAEWRSDQIALHDENDLGLVYRVIDAPGRGTKDARGRARKQVVSAAVAETAAALRSLHKKQPTKPDGLTDVEKEIFAALAPIDRRDKYAHADNIRAQNGMYERFIQGYQRSGLYEQFITSEMERNGLPRQLIGIAFVESLFVTGARSKVGAAGIWQFMSYTGKEYMHLNAVVDERWDPILATESAARYLKQARQELDTWPLAITSYNYGRAGMRALANAAGTHDFGVILAVTKGKRFGFSARNYYASFLAVLEVLDEAPRRLGGVKKFAPWAYDVVRAPFPLYAAQLTGTGVVDAATLDALNPALTPAALAGRVPLPHGLSLRVPRGSGDALLAALGALPAAEKQKAARAVQAVHVSNGRQTLAAIAKKYKLDAKELAERTGLALTAVPARGAKVAIPPATARYTLLPEARGMPLSAPLSASPVLLADAGDAATPDAGGASAMQTADDGVVAPPAARAPSAAAAPARGRPTGVVTARVSRIEAIGRDVRGVDIVAGRVVEAVFDVDVVAGAGPVLAAVGQPAAVRQARPRAGVASAARTQGADHPTLLATSAAVLSADLLR